MTWNHLEFSCSYISIVYTLLAKSEFSARTPNESCLNFLLYFSRQDIFMCVKYCVDHQKLRKFAVYEKNSLPVAQLP